MQRTSRLKSTATDPEYIKSVDRMIQAQKKLLRIYNNVDYEDD